MSYTTEYSYIFESDFYILLLLCLEWKTTDCSFLIMWAHYCSFRPISTSTSRDDFCAGAAYYLFKISYLQVKVFSVGPAFASLHTQLCLESQIQGHYSLCAQVHLPNPHTLQHTRICVFIDGTISVPIAKESEINGSFFWPNACRAFRSQIVSSA